ncbi:NCS1, partial [Symbiodinium pilosum]
NLILNATGVAAILWWSVASFRLHNLHGPSGINSEDVMEVEAPRVGKGGKGQPKVRGAKAPHQDPAEGSKVLPKDDAPSAPAPVAVTLPKGDIRWGNEETWHLIPAKPGSDMNTVTCSIQHLPDNVPGDDGKHCQCLVTPGSDFHRAMNPMLMDEADANSLGAELAASCQLFFDARKHGAADAAQWLATEGLCSEAWEEKALLNRSFKAGSRQINVETRQQLLRARVDVRFKTNWARLRDTDGWYRKAWVSYVGGPPTSQFVKMAEELIKSVHYFSEHPILMFNFGLFTPKTWSEERFPQLVILHAAPLPNEPRIRRSFNFNKLRAILMSRALNAVEVDVDQFVAPGADVLFSLTSKWVNKEYSFPLMPAHFLDWSIKDQPAAPWWPRYCPDPEKPCPMQTMRWCHAHPTWTHWALPFFGRWVRRHFRDERLPNVTVKGFHAPGLKVGDINEDEDLLNVGLWEERATKQWCKMDVPATVEFDSLLSWTPAHGHRCTNGIGCTNIGGDNRWYKKGVPKVYWTAHHAIDPEQTATYLERIRKHHKEGKWPAAIVYEERFWKSGDELKKEHPGLACLT